MTEQIEAFDVLEQGENYVLEWRGLTRVITSCEAPLGIAIDAACEFMDMVREDRLVIRRRFDEPLDFRGNLEGLMQFCVGRSWKQP